jgi:hypothetical protein
MKRESNRKKESKQKRKMPSNIKRQNRRKKLKKRKRKS